MGLSKDNETLSGFETLGDLVVEKVKGVEEKCYLKRISEEVENLPKEYKDCYECSGTLEGARERNCRRFGIFKSVEPMTYGERMKVLGL